MSDYISKQGDMVDAICHAHYGSESATVAVFDANPGLIDQPVPLVSGTKIELPELNINAVKATLSLWD